MNCYLWFYIFGVSYGTKVYTIVLLISFDPQVAFEPIGSKTNADKLLQLITGRQIEQKNSDEK